MIGYIGTFLLLTAYFALYFGKTSKLFIILDIIASLLLTYHAIEIDDIAFTLVNGIISFTLIAKLIKDYYVKNRKTTE